MRSGVAAQLHGLLRGTATCCKATSDAWTSHLHPRAIPQLAVLVWEHLYQSAVQHLPRDRSTTGVCWPLRTAALVACGTCGGAVPSAARDACMHSQAGLPASLFKKTRVAADDPEAIEGQRLADRATRMATGRLKAGMCGDSF